MVTFTVAQIAEANAGTVSGYKSEYGWVCIAAVASPPLKVQTLAEMVQEWFEEHNVKFKVLMEPPNSLVQWSICGMCWTNKANPQRFPFTAYKT